MSAPSAARLKLVSSPELKAVFSIDDVRKSMLWHVDYVILVDCMLHMCEFTSALIRLLNFVTTDFR